MECHQSEHLLNTRCKLETHKSNIITTYYVNICCWHPKQNICRHHKLKCTAIRSVPLLRAGVQPTLDPNVEHCVACPGLSPWYCVRRNCFWIIIFHRQTRLTWPQLELNSEPRPLRAPRSTAYGDQVIRPRAYTGRPYAAISKWNHVVRRWSSACPHFTNATVKMHMCECADLCILWT